MLQETQERSVEENSDRVVVKLKPWADTSKRFPLGSVAISGAAAATLDVEDLGLALSRHVVGDWGEVGDVEKLINDCCVEFGGGLRSVFRSECGTWYVISTDSARQVTTVTLATTT